MTLPEKAHLGLPLLSAMIFALSALAMKAASAARSSDVIVTTLWANAGTALGFAFFVDFSAPFLPEPLWPGLLIGGVFFLGQVCTVLAISRGAVSVATPVMSSKVVMVAFVLAFHLHLPPKWQTWLAAVLVVAGVACMQSGGSPATTASNEGARPPSIFAAVFFALLAALSYAVYDVMTQVYSSQMEFHRVVPFGMFVCFALSLLLLPFARRGALATRPPGMLFLSVILLTLQSLILITTIGKFGDAANCNIVYSSRGIFSVLFAWLLGSWFNVSEVSQPGVALRRLGGAAIILVAIALVLV